MKKLTATTDTPKKGTKATKNLPPTVIVGVSGGADSVFLLVTLLQFQKLHPLRMIVAHVNHKTRGKQSDADATFVKKMAQKYRLEYREKTLKKPVLKKSENLEELWRKSRYNFFESVRRHEGGQYIITAHHQDDNLETVLLNLVRGSFLQGLSGMQMVDPKRHLLRPLLSTSKEEILAYLRAKKIPWREDPSNQNNQFARNKIRNTVIPVLKQMNPNLAETILSNVKNIQKLQQTVNLQTEKWLQNQQKLTLGQNHTFSKKPVTPKFGAVRQQEFLKLPQALQQQMLVKMYRTLHGSTKKLTGKHLEQILSIVQKDKSNLQKEFGPGASLRIIKKVDGKRWIIAKKHKISTIRRLPSPRT